MEGNSLIPNLFRSEFSKIVSVLCKRFGLSNIQLAEDLTSDTFLKASETWGLKGIPDHPRAWLYQVAQNKAKDHFRREQIFNKKIAPVLNKENIFSEIEINLSEVNIKDSQLQMLFAVCHPTIKQEGQIALALRVLCGFGIEEISNALLSTKATINKRLYRTKTIIRQHNIQLVPPNKTDLVLRIDSVLNILYLLFNEGYYSASSEKAIQKELCIESMRLLYMLLNYPLTNTPKTNALMALFCFHASRFDARLQRDGTPILFNDQDKTKWNYELIAKGKYFLPFSTQVKSKYHLEAWIAYWHTQLAISKKDKWNNILQLYNQLIQIQYSPITALNRTYALAMAEGKAVGLKEALKIDLKENHLYQCLLAELHTDSSKQKHHLQLALKLARTEHDREIILRKLQNITQQSTLPSKPQTPPQK